MSLPPSWAGWSAILCVVGLNLTVADVENRRILVARISLLQFGVNAEQILALRKVMMREGRPDVESRSSRDSPQGHPTISRLQPSPSWEESTSFLLFKGSKPVHCQQNPLLATIQTPIRQDPYHLMMRPKTLSSLKTKNTNRDASHATKKDIRYIHSRRSGHRPSKIQPRAMLNGSKIGYTCSPQISRYLHVDPVVVLALATGHPSLSLPLVAATLTRSNRRPVSWPACPSRPARLLGRRDNA